jgi:hypothetical protein
VAVIVAIIALWTYLSGALDDEPDPLSDCLGPPRWCQQLRDAEAPGLASGAARQEASQ